MSAKAKSVERNIQHVCDITFSGAERNPSAEPPAHDQCVCVSSPAFRGARSCACSRRVEAPASAPLRGMDKYEEIRRDRSWSTHHRHGRLVREKALGARRLLVLKALPCEGEAATRIEDARNEARLLASARHPNVLPLVEAFRDAPRKRFVLVTEYARAAATTRAQSSGGARASSHGPSTSCSARSCRCASRSHTATAGACCTATSSRRTCCSPRRASCSSATSASRARSTARPRSRRPRRARRTTWRPRSGRARATAASATSGRRAARSTSSRRSASSRSRARRSRSSRARSPAAAARPRPSPRAPRCARTRARSCSSGCSSRTHGRRPSADALLRLPLLRERARARGRAARARARGAGGLAHDAAALHAGPTAKAALAAAPPAAPAPVEPPAPPAPRPRRCGARRPRRRPRRGPRRRPRRGPRSPRAKAAAGPGGAALALALDPGNAERDFEARVRAPVRWPAAPSSAAAPPAVDDDDDDDDSGVAAMLHARRQQARDLTRTMRPGAEPVVLAAAALPPRARRGRASGRTRARTRARQDGAAPPPARAPPSKPTSRPVPLSKPAAPAGASQRAVAAARESRGDAPDEGGARCRRGVAKVDESRAKNVHHQLEIAHVPVAAPRNREAEGDDGLSPRWTSGTRAVGAEGREGQHDVAQFSRLLGRSSPTLRRSVPLVLGPKYTEGGASSQRRRRRAAVMWGARRAEGAPAVLSAAPGS